MIFKFDAILGWLTLAATTNWDVKPEAASHVTEFHCSMALDQTKGLFSVRSLDPTAGGSNAGSLHAYVVRS